MPPEVCCHLACSKPSTHTICGPDPYGQSYGCDEHAEELCGDGMKAYPFGTEPPDWFERMIDRTASKG